jgi:hypothetical protein
MKGTALLVNKKDLRDCRIVDVEIPGREELRDNEVVLALTCFSFTSNNITYAAVGETMRYWDFFPAEAGWGKVPCWGFADVVASNCSDIGEGERIYGYFPMATHLVVEAGRVHPHGFYDVAAHRLDLPLIYNHYTRTKNDPGYRPEYEGFQSIFQPLFATSFLLDDYLEEKDLFGAGNIILTSASSKTAIALAYLLHRNRSGREREYVITGLTSSGNYAFVNSLGLYDQVAAYDDLGAIGRDTACMVADMAGNKQLLLSLQEELGKALIYSCHVGLSHWEDSSAPGHLGVANEFFFAPAQAEKRTKDWGGTGLRKKMAASYIPFLQFAAAWMTERKIEGLEAVAAVYDEMVNGKVNPAEGIVVSL